MYAQCTEKRFHSCQIYQYDRPNQSALNNQSRQCTRTTLFSSSHFPPYIWHMQTLTHMTQKPPHPILRDLRLPCACAAYLPLKRRSATA
jgi:hypothetical protein